MIKKICLAALLLSALIGCKSKSAFDYNQNFVKKEESMSADFDKSGTQIGTYIQNEQYDSVVLVAERMEKLVDSKLKEVKDEPAPDVKMGPEFKAAGIRYFDNIKSLYTSYKELGLAKTPEERATKLEKVQQAIEQNQKALNDIQGVQRRYADANGFKMEK